MGPVIEGARLGGQRCPKGVTIRRRAASFHQGPKANGVTAGVRLSSWRPRPKRAATPKQAYDISFTYRVRAPGGGGSADARAAIIK